AALLTVRLRWARLRAAANRPRRPGHPYLCADRTRARRASPWRLGQPCRLRPAARRPALVRSTLLDPLRGGHRGHPSVRAVHRAPDLRAADRPNELAPGAGRVGRRTIEPAMNFAGLAGLLR